MPLVRIDMIRGRSPEDKQRLYQTLAGWLDRVGVDGKDLFISYFENGPEDWSFADGRAQYVEGEVIHMKVGGLACRAGRDAGASASW